MRSPLVSYVVGCNGYIRNAYVVTTFTRGHDIPLAALSPFGNTQVYTSSLQAAAEFGRELCGHLLHTILIETLGDTLQEQCADVIDGIVGDCLECKLPLITQERADTHTEQAEQLHVLLSRDVAARRQGVTKS